MPKIKNFTEFLVEFLPWFALIILVIVIFVFFLIGNLDMVKRGLITVGIPVIFASVLVIIEHNAILNKDYHEYLGVNVGISLANHVLFFILIYLISIAILISNMDRSVSYFLLIAFLGGILLIEVISLKPYQNFKTYIILFQTLFLSLSLCLGVTLKYPLYFGYTDMFVHMNYFELILANGHITSAMDDYQYFPIFHLLNSIQIMVTGMNSQISYSIFSSLIFSFLIILIYLISMQITKNRNISIMASLLFSFSHPIIFASLYAVTGTTSYIYCLLILYFLINEKRDLKIAMLSIFLILPLVLTHQITLVLFLLFLILLMLIGVFFQYSKLIILKYILVFVSSFLAYWFYLCGPFISRVLQMLHVTSELIVINAESPVILPFWTTPIRNMDFIMITFLALLGGFMMVKQRENKLVQVLGLVAIILLPLYIPIIAGFFSFILGYRFPVYVSPFVAIASSFGIYGIMRIISLDKPIYHRAKPVIIFILISAIFLVSPIMVAKTIDLDEFPTTLGLTDKLYFTHEELNSFSFYKAHRDINSDTYTDYPSFRYIHEYFRLPCSDSIDVFSLNQLIGPSYFIFREAQYLSAKKLNFHAGENIKRGFSSRISQAWWLYRDPYPGSIWSKQESVYNNGEVKLFYKIA